MPIVGRTPDECFNRFRKHLGELVSATLTDHPIVRHRMPDTKLVVGFRSGEQPIAVPIKTKFGRLFFYLGQKLVAVPMKEKGYQLQTEEYWYRLHSTASVGTPALIRWEYKKTPHDTTDYCRHHIQIRSKVRVAAGTKLNLDKLHIATGYTLIEYVLRFLIRDLGAPPPCGDEWPKVLARSEKVFREEFRP